ncbi:helix-turn-helix domain-containing protein [Gordonia westfalica]|uniref:Helix-turn-helix domain-containing protein n=1 Tax=Gordonia westfalica TaxID=158898 RepID=A0ABU2GZY6_9ACTN|nr:helix-turn-helix domain-containing protein [Gordonia westfalica]MDS1116545.1 helix-turn-helix domain-containing protein [Gordonia westfalica]
MDTSGEPADSADGTWTTPQVADFLGISRQAINKRVRNRKMLGYAGNGSTLFPTWQFDLEHKEIRAEVPEFLAAFDETVEPTTIANWSITRSRESGRSPVDLLLSAESHEDAIRLASAYSPSDAEEHAAAAVDSAAPRTGKQIAAWAPSSARANKAQHAILLAAADLFSRKGPAKVTLREVAAAADVSYGLIHRFYRTKENLLVAVMELLVSYGGERLSGEEDAYAAIENSFGADVDSGQFGRMLMWSIFEGTPPDRLLGGVRAGGYLSQIDALWEKPAAPKIRSEFDSSVVAALVGLVASVWDLYEPYLTELQDGSWRDSDDIRAQVTELLQLLVYASRPNR